MTRTLYIDCPTGLSGDMFIASLLDAGAGMKTLKSGLAKLKLKGYTLKVTKERRQAVEGTRFKVLCGHEHHHRTFKDIKAIIEKSGLDRDIKDTAIAIFKNLAIAEGKVHGIAADKVHFHEVGAVDSIVDIVGAAILLKSLGIGALYSSEVPLGSGRVMTDHGMLPIPAPATIELMKGVPIAPSDIKMELTTPTGAAILKTLAKGFGPMPAMTIESIGYGCGGKDLREFPNAARAVIGASSKNAKTGEKVIVIETNIDDMSPQIAGYLTEKLLKEGALDAYVTPVFMKKQRPAILLTVLTVEESRDRLVDLIFAESSTIGVRCHETQRTCLERKSITLKTEYGQIKAKMSVKNGRTLNIQPEYEDCRRIAEKKHVPLKKIIESAIAAAAKKRP
ncbi:MAG: nickel pincer cofactor biosynthesis protein LarC [Deltaproteobacteria bacterium]|nr:nickel pincer cofactor biosynthesis protein LarC [Deltaproteobacteria bacterium]